MNAISASPARRPSTSKRIWRFLLYALLIISALVMAFPLMFSLSGSVSTLADYIRTPWFPIPTPPTLDNYRIILFGKTDVLLWIKNTLIRAAWYIIIPAVIAFLGGYAFARLRFRGRDAAFLFLLSSLMLPGIVFQVPTFVMLARWPLAGGNDIMGQGGFGLINQWPALLITGLVNVFYIFMFRQTFSTIPGDFEEAARVDGAGTLRCLWTVYLPMLKPTFTVLIIFQFVAIWNDYIWPLFVSASNKAIWTLSLGFQSLALNGNATKGLPSTTTDYPFLFALATISIGPLILMYFFLQRFFVEGVQGFAVKG
jgi:multiple sugar transport system permease protein